MGSKQGCMTIEYPMLVVRICILEDVDANPYFHFRQSSIQNFDPEKFLLIEINWYLSLTDQECFPRPLLKLIYSFSKLV